MQFFVRMGALDGYIEFVEQLGIEPFSLLERVNILPAQTADPDLMIPYSTIGKLLEYSAEELHQPFIGARVGRGQGLSTVGLVGVYMAQQESIGKALQCAQKFADMHAQGVELRLVELPQDKCELALNMRVNDRQQFPQLVQMSLGLIKSLIGEMAGNRWHNQTICLRQHLSEVQQQQLKVIFGCDVVSGCNHDSLVFERRILALKPKQPEHLLDNIIEKQFRQRQVDTFDQTKLVRHAINVLLPTGDCSKQSIAASLGMHPKKLERLLAAENITFRQLLENTRKDIALKTLDMKQMPMTTLALNLGYSDFSAFSRSFKRWTGISPSQYRKAY